MKMLKLSCHGNECEALIVGIDKHGRVNEWNLKIAEIMVWPTPNTTSLVCLNKCLLVVMFGDLAGRCSYA